MDLGVLQEPDARARALPTSDLVALVRPGRCPAQERITLRSNLLSTGVGNRCACLATGNAATLHSFCIRRLSLHGYQIMDVACLTAHERFTQSVLPILTAPGAVRQPRGGHRSPTRRDLIIKDGRET